LRRQSGDPSEIQKTLKDAKKFVKSNADEPVMFGVFENEEDPMLKLFFDANNPLRDDYVFGHTFDPEAKAFFKLSGSSIMVVHPPHLQSKYEKQYNVLSVDAKSTADDVRSFYVKHHVPLVGNFQTHTEARFAKRPLVLVFYDVDFTPKMRTMTQFWRNRVVEVAHNNPDILFAVADEVAHEARLKDAGLEETGNDVNIVFYDENDRRFPMGEEFADDSLQEFVDDCNAGNVKPKIKSQKPPKKQKNVKVVVGETFDSIVKDESKEVLIEFYAPWCGHCKTLEPVYNNLAKKLKKHKNLVIAKMDSTANEGPAQYKAEGFPTLYWAPPGKKDTPIKYEGGRTLEDFEKFLSENSAALSATKKKEEL